MHEWNLNNKFANILIFIIIIKNYNYNIFTNKIINKFL